MNKLNLKLKKKFNCKKIEYKKLHFFQKLFINLIMLICKYTWYVLCFKDKYE